MGWLGGGVQRHGRREDAAANLVKICQTERVSRTRRTDFMLALSGLAAESLRRQLGGVATHDSRART
jgi:hypothetical protein